MQRLTVIAVIAVALFQVYQVNAISITFDSDTLMTTKVTINHSDIWTINDDITVIMDNSTTNYGTLVIKGSLLNNNIINNYGIIINNDTLINNYRINNYGIIINNGIMNNTYVLNNVNIINNTGIINNKGYIYNFGNIYNNTGTVNDKDMLALFPGIVTGKINNEGSIIEPDDSSNTFPTSITFSITCNLILSNDIINGGEKITASVDTNANNVLFEWIDPLGNIQRSITDSNAPFEDIYTPTTHGEWTVKATCDDVTDSNTFILNFNVLSESPIGVIAIVGASTSILAVYMYRRIH